MLDYKPIDIPMHSNVKLLPDQGEPHSNVRKLNYLTMNRSDISFVISVVNLSHNSPYDSHWDA